MANKEAGIVGLAHIGVFVSDIEKSKAFYTDIFGLRLLHENSIDTDDGTIRVAFVGLNGLTIELVKLPADGKRADGPVDHIAFKVNNIEEIVERLKNKGIEFNEDIYVAEHFWDAGAKWILFRGPDNEHLELSEVL